VPVVLTIAFAILGTAILLGSVLTVLYLRTEGARAAPWPLTTLHGLLGVGGLFCLALALRGPVRGLEQGTGSFGIIAATLIGSAALFGLGLLLTHLLRRRLPGILIGIHATLAVGGFAILAAYVFAG
jgi:hypothetical protein